MKNMKNVIWTKSFNVIIKGKPDWNKGIHEVVFSENTNGIFCAGVLYYDEYSKKEGEAFFRLEQFQGSTMDDVWNQMDAWVDSFCKGMGGFDYQERK